MTKPTSRRELLRLGIGAGLAAGSAHVLGDAALAKAATDVTSSAPSIGARPVRPARVHAARGKDLAAVTRAALQSLGGMARWSSRATACSSSRTW